MFGPPRPITRPDGGGAQTCCRGRRGEFIWVGWREASRATTVFLSRIEKEGEGVWGGDTQRTKWIMSHESILGTNNLLHVSMKTGGGGMLVWNYVHFSERDNQKENLILPTHVYSGIGNSAGTARTDWGLYVSVPSAALCCCKSGYRERPCLRKSVAFFLMH